MLSGRFPSWSLPSFQIFVPLTSTVSVFLVLVNAATNALSLLIFPVAPVEVVVYPSLL